MKLVQKLPAALAIACLMMMSSCSKDDVQAPAPKVESANSNSNLKVEAVVPAAAITSTKGYYGIDILPANWDRNNTGYSSDQNAYPTGVSCMTTLWGDASKPFVQNLSLIPWAPGVTTFITVTTSGPYSGSGKSSVKTKIRYLTHGKKYALTVYVASSLPKGTGHAPTFAKKGLITLGSSVAPQETVVDLTNYKSCWVQKVITFTAVGSEMNFAFSALSALPGQYAYAHLLVPDSAVKLVN